MSNSYQQRAPLTKVRRFISWHHFDDDDLKPFDQYSNSHWISKVITLSNKDSLNWFSTRSIMSSITMWMQQWQSPIHSCLSVWVPLMTFKGKLTPWYFALNLAFLSLRLCCKNESKAHAYIQRTFVSFIYSCGNYRWRSVGRRSKKGDSSNLISDRRRVRSVKRYAEQIDLFW